MSELRRIIIANFKQGISSQQKRKELVTNVLQLHYIKNVLRYLGRVHHWSTSMHLNFNRMYQEPLYQLLSIVDDDTRIFEFIGILNMQKKDFFLYILTVCHKKWQVFTLRYYIQRPATYNVGLIHFFHNCFRELFLEKKYAKGLLFSTFSDEMKKYLVNIASIENDDEFFQQYLKLINSPNFNVVNYVQKVIFSIHDEQFI